MLILPIKSLFYKHFVVNLAVQKSNTNSLISNMPMQAE